MNKKPDILLFLQRFPVVSILSLMVLSACTTKSIAPDSDNASDSESTNNLRCLTPQIYANKVIGTGHCVSLIKTCTQSPNTNAWRPGSRVMSLEPESIEPGTVIATFKDGRYPNKHGWHAAIYIRHTEKGIYVWDQWLGKPVHQRLIRVRNDGADAGNTAQAYRIVHIPR